MRNRTIERVQEVGRRTWKKEEGYHQQARVENAFFRYKMIVGDRLRARTEVGRKVEARIACERDPYLRARVPREHLATCWAGAAGLPQLQSELGAFRARLVEAKKSGGEPAEVKRRA